MATAKHVTLTVAGAFAGLLMVAQTADAQCYGYNCNWYGGTYSQYRAPAAYAYAPSTYEGQSLFPNVVLSSDSPNLYLYGYAVGYRDAYGCLWIDRQCPRS